MAHFFHFAVLTFIATLLFFDSIISTPLEESADSYTSNNETEEMLEEDPERESMIKLKSATSLESLLLEAIRLGGTEVCSSPFVRGVMLGTWRNGTPDRDEMRDNFELRRTCYNALLKTSSTVAPVLPGPRILPAPRYESNTLNNTIETTDELTFALVQHQPAISNPRGSRIGPTGRQAPAAKNTAADTEVLQKMDEIIKDRSAECKPRKIPVEIPVENNVTWLPPCTLIERCTGCCKHPSLHCVPPPEGISIIKKKVVAMDPKGRMIGVKQVNIEKHNKCKCQCKIQAKDCNELQSYDSKNCKCVCKQNGSKPSSSRPTCTSPQYWDERSCKCRCPEQTITECSTGSYFSSEQCRCVTALDIIRTKVKEAAEFL